MIYRRTGRSGLDLPAISLGLWHNFGSVDPFDVARAMVLHAFDIGITHFDLANNYGPEAITDARRSQIAQLDALAVVRGQSLAQLAIAWVLRHEAVTSALIGASRVAQIDNSVAALDRLHLSAEELRSIDLIAPARER